MRKLCLTALLCILPLATEATTVTGTIHDPTGLAYSNGVVTATFLSPRNFNGTPLSNGSPFGLNVSGTTNVNGFFSITLTDLSTVVPVGGQWDVVVVTGGARAEFLTNLVVGSSIDLSSQLNAVAAIIQPLPPNTFSPVVGSGVPTANCIPPGLNNVGQMMYWDAVNFIWYYCSALNTWTRFSSSGGVTSFNTRTGAVVPASGDYTLNQVGVTPLISAPANPASGNAVVWIDSTANSLECKLSSGASCLSSGSGSPGSPSASPQANNAGAFAGVPFDLYPHLSSGESGAGTAVSPWVNSTDNSAGINTAISNFTRGGLIRLPAGQFNITSPVAMNGFSIRIAGESMGDLFGANGAIPSPYGTQLRIAAPGNIFNVGGPLVSGSDPLYLQIEQLGMVGNTPTTPTEANACIHFTQVAGGNNIKNVHALNCGITYGFDSGSTTDGTRMYAADSIEAGYGLRTEPTAIIFDWMLLNSGYNDNDMQGLFASVPSGGGTNERQSILGDFFRRDCRMTACNTNPANMFWGGNASALIGNPSSDPGLCGSFDPNCGAGSTNPADATIIAGSSNAYIGNPTAGAVASGRSDIHLVSGATMNEIALNPSTTTGASQHILLDSGANDNAVIEPLPLSVVDNGSRNTINNVGTNVGDPNVAGAWNGHAKWPGLWIYDTADQLAYQYVTPTVRFGYVNNGGCGVNGGVAIYPSSTSASISCATPFTFNSNVITYTPTINNGFLINAGTTQSPFKITTSDTTGTQQIGVFINPTAPTAFAIDGFCDDLVNCSAFGVSGSGNASGAFGPKSFFVVGSTAAGYGVNYVTRNSTGNHNFYCNSTTTTCLVGGANGNWEFKNQLTVDSFASASSTPVCSNSGTLATCTGISSVLTGTTGSIGGSALLAGQCAAGTATVTGATSAMVATASPSSDPDSNLSTGVGIYAFVSGSNTVTVRVCAIVAVTPAATTYNVRVLQ